MLRRLIILLLLLSLVSIGFAQESTEAPAEQTEEAATQAPESTPEILPTAEQTEPVGVTTEAPTSEAPTAEATVYAPLPEPALNLWASDSFENSVSAYWFLPADWQTTGTGLNITTANRAYFSEQSFMEVAVQAQVHLVAGATVSVFVRDAYRASLSSDGRLSLWRDATELATMNVSVNPEGHFLRLSAFGDSLRLGLDGQTLLLAQDTTYSTGRIGVQVDFSESASVTLDNFGVWLPPHLIPATPEALETEVVQTEVPAQNQNGDASLQALIPPNLLQPALNGVANSLRPTFSWQARTGAVEYQLRIASNFSCSTTVVPDIPVTGTSYIPNFDIPQGEYWFCVQAKDSNGDWSGFGEKRRFVINLSNLPVNLGIIQTNSTPINVTFSWTAVAGANYVLEIAADDSSFSVSQSYNTTNTSYVLPLGYGQYYWRVWVNGNALPMSLARSVYVSPPLPLASVASLPLVNNAYTNDTNPTLNWTVPANWVPPKVGQSLTYEFALSTLADFSSLVTGFPVTGIPMNSHEWTATTLTDGVYYWRVRARTNLGLYSPWSAAYILRIDTVPQAAPNLLSPADAVFVRTARPAFTWAAVTGASRYLLEVTQDNSDYDPLVISTSVAALTFTATSSLSQGEYYWRVWSLDAAGNQSLTANERSFTVDYRLTPIEEQVFVSANPVAVTFSWRLVTGATGAIYQVEIANDAGFTDMELVSPLRSTGSWVSPALPPGRYYWRLVVTGYGISGGSSFVVSPLLPNAPLQTSPANAIYLNDVNPDFSWNVPTLNAAHINGYEFQLSTNKNFTTAGLVGGTISVAGTSHIISPDLPLTAGTVYYWRVRAVTALGPRGAFSAARVFVLDTSPQLAPNLVSPIDSLTIASARPVFSWAASAGASRYLVEISQDNSDFDPLITSMNSNRLTAATTISLPQGIYYWRVWSLDAAGNQSLSPSVSRSFTVDYSLTPANEQVFVSAAARTMSFSWSLVTGATGAIYQVEIANDAGFSDMEQVSPMLSTGTWVSPALPHGRYYWRLLVTNYGISTGRTFVISPALPNAPALLSPANSSFTNDVSPGFSWNLPTLNAGNVVSYEFQLSTNATFTAAGLVGGTISVAGTSHTVSPDLPLTNGTTYYWRVRAVTNLGAKGAFSTARTFVLDTTAPAVPTMISPIGGVNVYGNLPQLRWALVAGANRYEVRYGLSNDLSAVSPNLIATNLFNVPSPLMLEAWHWQVRALDAAGNVSAWSSVQIFIVNSALTSVPTPWNFETATPTLTWAPLYWAADYEIQVSTNATFSNIVFTDTVGNALINSISTSALGNGRYYWRVRAQSPASVGGAWGAWSVTESFTIGIP